MTEPVDLSPHFKSRLIHVLTRVVKVTCLVIICVMELHGSHERYFQYGNGRPKPELYGIHDVTAFTVDGVEIHLTERDLSKYDLVSRTFTWINETPRNR